MVSAAASGFIKTARASCRENAGPGWCAAEAPASGRPQPPARCPPKTRDRPRSTIGRSQARSDAGQRHPRPTRGWIVPKRWRTRPFLRTPTRNRSVGMPAPSERRIAQSPTASGRGCARSSIRYPSAWALRMAASRSPAISTGQIDPVTSVTMRQSGTICAADGPATKTLKVPTRARNFHLFS